MTDQTENSLLGDEHPKPEDDDAGARQKKRRGNRFQQKEGKSESSLNFHELRELIELMAAHGLTEFELERDSFRVHLKRNFGSQASAETRLTVHPGALSTLPAPLSPQGSAMIASEEELVEENLFMITAPIVGTFYRSASPASDSFVKSGSQIEPETVVCIIEAMKLMNEIQAETSGEVVKIYVENGQPVEYGQKLFGIKR